MAWDALYQICEERARRCLAAYCDGPWCDTKPARDVLRNACLLEFEIVEEERL